MEIDDLVENLAHSVSLEFKPKHFFIKDINRILDEITKYQSVMDLNIYEICEACGNDLTWDFNYYISQEDLKWFKNQGRTEFITYLSHHYKLDTYISINAIQIYKSISDIHKQLCELFELQLE